jgi:sn-glycerol 3-phosphate transport system permease protein
MSEQNNLRFERWWTRAVIAFVIVFSTGFIITQRQGLGQLAAWLWNGLSQTPQALQNVVSYYAALPGWQLLPSLFIGGIFGAGMLVALRVRQPITPANRRGLGALAVIGGLGGALGSQLLNLPLQHCTYAAGTEAAQIVLGVLLTIVSTFFVLLPIWAFLERLNREQRFQATAGYFRSPLLPYLLLTPTLLSLLLFLYYPSIQTLTLSLNMRRFPLPQERFVCLGNYLTLAQDTIYRNSFAITLILMLGIVVLSLAAALGIAVLASQKIRGASIYRTLLIWPFALSPVVVGTIFLSLFREGSSGILNYTLQSVFGVSFSWLRDATLAPWVIVLASVWNILGFNILFYIAGLQNIPMDLLEAAQIDGANKPQRFLRITFPLLAPFTFFLLITNVTYGFYGIYGAVDTLTLGAGGGRRWRD